MGKLENKVAVVTGAASGMGRAISVMYAQEGAKVVLADYNLEGAEEAAKEIIAAGGTALAVKADVADSNDIAAMIDTAISEYGSLDILVNNAGIMDSFEPVGEVTDEKWEHIFDVNTKGVLLCESPSSCSTASSSDMPCASISSVMPVNFETPSGSGLYWRI